MWINLLRTPKSVIEQATGPPSALVGGWAARGVFNLPSTYSYRNTLKGGVTHSRHRVTAAEREPRSRQARVRHLGEQYTASVRR